MKTGLVTILSYANLAVKKEKSNSIQTLLLLSDKCNKTLAAIFSLIIR